MTTEQRQIVHEIIKADDLEAFKLACSAYTKNDMIDCVADVTTTAMDVFNTKVRILWTHNNTCHCSSEKNNNKLGTAYDLDLTSVISIDRQKALIRARELYNRVNRNDEL